MPVIPVNKMGDKKKIIWKRRAEEERHKGCWPPTHPKKASRLLMMFTIVESVTSLRFSSTLEILLSLWQTLEPGSFGFGLFSDRTFPWATTQKNLILESNCGFINGKNWQYHWFSHWIIKLLSVVIIALTPRWWHPQPEDNSISNSKLQSPWKRFFQPHKSWWTKTSHILTIPIIKPETRPTTVSYNASAVNIYSATNRKQRFRIISFYMYFKTL
jgi:hypothetical protein